MYMCMYMCSCVCVSVSVISSGTDGNSGIYELQEKNGSGSISPGNPVVVSECVHQCVAVRMALSCLHSLFCMCG